MTEKNDSFAVTCRDLCIGYGKDVILSGINLEIKKGTYIPFVGVNGAGKTTLLRTILGLLPPISGELVVSGGKVPGYVPQISTLDRLYPVTARQVIYMGFYPRLGIWKKPDSTMIQQAHGLIKRFNLEKHVDRPIEELSGGMRQKVLIARALLAGSEMLIMDEPAAGLDEKSEFALVEQLYQICASEGKTILFAQHSLAPILDYAKFVCHFNQGQVSLIKMEDFKKPLQDRMDSALNNGLQEKINV